MLAPLDVFVPPFSILGFPLYLIVAPELALTLNVSVAWTRKLDPDVAETVADFAIKSLALQLAALVRSNDAFAVFPTTVELEPLVPVRLKLCD